MTDSLARFEEPLRATLTRTLTIALIGGTVLSLMSKGRLFWPIAVTVMLWPSLGGHYVEIWFLHWLRPRLPAERGAQLFARLGTWFVAGVLFAWCMALTARMLTGMTVRAIPWWVGGLGFIGIELVAHLALRSRRRPSVYDGASIIVSLLVCITLFAACADRQPARMPVNGVRPGRQPVALYGTWIQMRPRSGDTLQIRPGGTANGPSIDPELGIGRTTRWEVLGIGMLCLGDPKSMACRGLRVSGDTLRLADRHGSLYLRRK